MLDKLLRLLHLFFHFLHLFTSHLSLERLPGLTPQVLELLLYLTRLPLSLYFPASARAVSYFLAVSRPLVFRQILVETKVGVEITKLPACFIPLFPSSRPPPPLVFRQVLVETKVGVEITKLRKHRAAGLAQVICCYYIHYIYYYCCCYYYFGGGGVHQAVQAGAACASHKRERID